MFSGEHFNQNYINKSQPKITQTHNNYSQHFSQPQAQLPTQLPTQPPTQSPAQLQYQEQIQSKIQEIKEKPQAQPQAQLFSEAEQLRVFPKSMLSIVKFNVGGVLFTTTIETLYHIYYFRKLIDESTPTLFTDGYYFINRDGNLFNYIFKFVRDNEMPIVNYKSINELKKVVKEALYYQYELLSIDLNKKIEEYEKNPKKYILVSKSQHIHSETVTGWITISLSENVSNKLEQGYDFVGGVGYNGNECYQAMRL